MTFRRAARTHDALRAVRDWSADEVHHRAQAMNMLRLLGVPTEDLDYNAIMYTRRPA